MTGLKAQQTRYKLTIICIDQVASLGCTDADGDTLTYTFTSGNGDNKFAIGVNSGAITLANSESSSCPWRPSFGKNL